MKEKSLEEKDIIEILVAFERELDEKLQESKAEVERVKYYETFQINEINFRNIFIATEKDSEGNISYHLYCRDSSNEILSVDENGNIEIKNPEVGKYLESLDFNELIEENEQHPERLKGISEKASPEEMKKALTGKEISKEEKENKNDKIGTDLKEQGIDLKISEYRQIKDSHISERMPEVFKDGKENGIAFSNKLNRFVIISKVNGQYQLNENVEPARMTWKTIISISPDGKQVERKVPYSLMRIPNNLEKEIAVTLDEYGNPSIETVDVMSCQERIARQVREENEGINQEETREMRINFETKGKEYKHDIAHGMQKLEQAERNQGKTVDYDRTPDDYIPNTDMTWGELMEKTGDPLPTLIERYENEMKGKNPEDSQQVVEEIEADYEMVNHDKQY